jgi:hypothetical protein
MRFQRSVEISSCRLFALIVAMAARDPKSASSLSSFWPVLGSFFSYISIRPGGYNGSLYAHNAHSGAALGWEQAV